jgi:tetratricopeptide (TPR) repeat protein
MTLMLTMPRIAHIALLLASFCLVLPAGAQSDDYQEAAKLFRAGQHAQALERVDNALKSNPKDARSRFLKGLILTEQNKPADAIKIFTALTQDFPELPEPYNNLAVLYASQGQYDKARSSLEMAIRTHPSYATAHENLGDIYAKMASQAYDKALQLDKNNSAAQTKLEMIKELFSGGARTTKPVIGKADTGAKGAPTPTVVATATKPAATPAVPVSVAPPVAPPTPVAAVPVPAAKPAAVEPSPAKSADSAGDVLKAVNGWAKAWSDNDVAGYLGFYAPDFQTPAGEPRADWEAARKIRIAKPKKIDVRVESPKVKFTDNNRVTVTFRQSYRSANLKVASTKTLVMVKAGERWLIQQERVGG